MSKQPEVEVSYTDNNFTNKVISVSRTTAAYVALLDRIAATLDNLLEELRRRR